MASITPRLADAMGRQRDPRQFLVRNLEQHGGNVSATARALGVTRATLLSWMQQHGVSVETVIKEGA